MSALPQTFEMAGGLFVDLGARGPILATIEDIAHSLSLQCRYGGATSRLYTVAEHSVLVADRLRAQRRSRLIQLAGLLHDAAEAIVTDVPLPAKVRLAGFRALEDRVMIRLLAGLGHEGLPIDDPAVRAADRWAARCEVFELLPSRGEHWPQRHDGVTRGLGVSPAKARASFLERYCELT